MRLSGGNEDEEIKGSGKEMRLETSFADRF
jgi:hypothetical protein